MGVEERQEPGNTPGLYGVQAADPTPGHLAREAGHLVTCTVTCGPVALA